MMRLRLRVGLLGLGVTKLFRQVYQRRHSVTVNFKMDSTILVDMDFTDAVSLSGGARAEAL